MLTKKQQTQSNRIKPKKESVGKAKKPFDGSNNRNRKGCKKKTNGLGCIVDSKRIKPKYDGKNNKSLTALESEFLEWLHTLNEVCFCCGEQNGIEWHHVKLYSTDAKDNTILIPLCGVKCHRLGQELSAHGTPKKWRDTFSMDMQNAYGKVFWDRFLRERSLC